jgi:hypothetical protein
VGLESEGGRGERGSVAVLRGSGGVGGAGGVGGGGAVPQKIWRYMFFLRHRWKIVLPDISSYGKIPGTHTVGSWIDLTTDLYVTLPLCTFIITNAVVYKEPYFWVIDGVKCTFSTFLIPRLIWKETIMKGSLLHVHVLVPTQSSFEQGDGNMSWVRHGNQLHPPASVTMGVANQLNTFL